MGKNPAGIGSNLENSGSSMIDALALGNGSRCNPDSPDYQTEYPQNHSRFDEVETLHAFSVCARRKRACYHAVNLYTTVGVNAQLKLAAASAGRKVRLRRRGFWRGRGRGCGGGGYLR